MDEQDQELQDLLKDLDLESGSDDDDALPTPSIFAASEDTPALEETALPPPPALLAPHRNGTRIPAAESPFLEAAAPLPALAPPPAQTAGLPTLTPPALLPFLPPPLKPLPTAPIGPIPAAPSQPSVIDRSAFDISFTSKSLGAFFQAGEAAETLLPQPDAPSNLPEPPPTMPPASAQEPAPLPAAPEQPPPSLSALFGGDGPAEDSTEPSLALGHLFGPPTAQPTDTFFDFLAGDRPAAAPRTSSAYDYGGSGGYVPVSSGFQPSPADAPAPAPAYGTPYAYGDTSGYQQQYEQYEQPGASGGYGAPYWDGVQWIYPGQSQHVYKPNGFGAAAASAMDASQYYPQQQQQQGTVDAAPAATASYTDAQQYYSGYSQQPQQPQAPETAYSHAYSDYYSSAQTAPSYDHAPQQTGTGPAPAQHDGYASATAAAAPVSYFDPTAAYSASQYGTQQPQPQAQAQAPTPKSWTPTYNSTATTTGPSPPPSVFIPGGPQPTPTSAQPGNPQPSPSSNPYDYSSFSSYATSAQQSQSQSQPHPQPAAYSPYGTATPAPPPQQMTNFFLPGASATPESYGAGYGLDSKPQFGGSHAHAAASTAYAPRSFADAMTMNAGRPPCALVAFGFGGWFATLRPGTVPERLEITPVKTLMLQRLRKERAAFASHASLAFMSPAGEDTQPESDLEVLERSPGPVQDLLLGLESFPGPLVNPLGGPRLKQLTEFLRLRAAQTADPDLRTLYALLLIAANNNGLFRAAAATAATAPAGKSSAEPPEPIEQQIARALATTTAPPAPLFRPAAAPLPSPDLVLREVQQLLTAGRRVEAAVSAVRGGLHGLGALLAAECPPPARQELLGYVIQQTVQPDAPLHAYMMVLAGRTSLETHTAAADLTKLLEPAAGDGTAEKDAGGGKFSARGLGLGSFFGLSRRNSHNSTAGEGLDPAGLSSTPRAGDAGSAALNPFAGAAPGGPVSPSFSPMSTPSTGAPAALPLTAPVEDRWREVVSMLAATRPAGDLEVIRQLGAKLMARGNAAAAHCCFLLAPPCLPGPYGPSESHVCLLGADHRAQPRTYVTVDALQRTEVLEWYLQLHYSPASSMAASLQQAILTLQPYRILAALRLTDAGHLQKALKYCEAVQATFKMVQRFPPSLMICRDIGLDLERRIRASLGSEAPLPSSYGAGSAGSGGGGGSLVGSLSRLIDRSITRLVGMEDEPGAIASPAAYGGGGGGPAPHMDGYMTPSAHSAMNTGAPPSPSPSIPPLSPEPNRRQGSELEGDDGAAVPRSPLGPSSARRSEEPNGRKNAERRRQGSIGSLFTGLSGLLAPLAPKASGKEIKLGQSNRFFYDEKLGKWREEGSEAVPDAGPPPPPPTGLAWGGAPPTAAPPMGGAGALSANGPALEPAAKPPMPPMGTTGGRRDVRARYVDSGFGGGPSAAAPAPSLGLGLRPPAAGLTPSAAPSMMMVAPPSSFQFFTPGQGSADESTPPPLVSGGTGGGGGLGPQGATGPPRASDASEGYFSGRPSLSGMLEGSLGSSTSTAEMMGLPPPRNF